MVSGTAPGGAPARVDWLIGGATTVSQPQVVLVRLRERLAACGLPLHRVAVFLRTLHPDVIGRRFLWRHDDGVLVSEADYGMPATDTYHRAPVPVLLLAKPTGYDIAVLSYRIRKLATTTRYPAAKLLAAGFSPTISAVDGLRRTAAWFATLEDARVVEGPHRS